MSLAPLPAAKVLDAYFLGARSKLPDLAAVLDRIDRGDEAEADDPRVERIRQALAVPADATGGRAERIPDDLLAPLRPQLEAAGAAALTRTAAGTTGDAHAFHARPLIQLDGQVLGHGGDRVFHPGRFGVAELVRRGDGRGRRHGPLRRLHHTDLHLAGNDVGHDTRPDPAPEASADDNVGRPPRSALGTHPYSRRHP